MIAPEGREFDDLTGVPVPIRISGTRLGKSAVFLHSLINSESPKEFS
jgi:hypothetical protein